ncbi:hypothetical protein GCM10011574_59260 [Microbispora bryophytorum]|uniref:Uncharacterized protein n=1 Tax=Microbispora bryophytorum TaxID=1460882 RepID=A0A8H9H535_9ACTN|nr:hypothetical protein GCM10011574_59260 [Microbispora bryophytorum]
MLAGGTQKAAAGLELDMRLATTASTRVRARMHRPRPRRTGGLRHIPPRQAAAPSQMFAVIRLLIGLGHRGEARLRAQHLNAHLASLDLEPTPATQAVLMQLHTRPRS